MSFYISSKGQFQHYNFKYLEGEFENARLERTAIHSDEAANDAKLLPKEKVDFFAIDIMNRPVISMIGQSLIKDIRDLMHKKNVRHIPLMDNDKLVGMISDRDLLKVDLSGTFLFLKATDVMTTLLIVADEETPLAHIARVLMEEKISALPIIDKAHKLTGMISRTDILRAVVYNKLVLK